MQGDVVGVNWKSHGIFLGECKWGTGLVDRQVARELIEKATLLLKDMPDKDSEWRIHYGLFSRVGFTPATVAEMQNVNGLLVDLKQLDSVLGH